MTQDVQGKPEFPVRDPPKSHMLDVFFLFCSWAGHVFRKRFPEACGQVFLGFVGGLPTVCYVFLKMMGGAGLWRGLVLRPTSCCSVFYSVL